MKKPIFLKDVLRQLKADLIGKDSYRGVTLTYSWLANQFGHFSLGYVPTLIVYSFLKGSTIENPSFWAAVSISCLWLLFETYNFLGPLLLDKQSQSKLSTVARRKYTFQPAWRNVAFDTFTDICFFWFGAFSASLFLQFSRTVVYILITIFLILIYPVRYWFLTKMYIQYAGLPIQFRLSQWEGDMGENDKKTVLEFLDTENNSLGKHLLIFGGRGSGKNLLSVGIATELSIKRYSCSYYTGMKLYSLFSLTDQEIIKAENCNAWSWRTASLLVIDDINPGSPISQIFISPHQLLTLIDTPVRGNMAVQNRRELINKNVIWVMGDKDNESNQPNGWIKLLRDIGVAKDKIYSIEL